jgi:hypothetical protein
MAKWFHVLVGAWSVASAGGACGCSSSNSSGSPGNTDGGSLGPTIDQACTDGAAAICAKIESCSATLAKIVYGDVATCRTRLKPACVSGLGAPSTGSTPQRAAECTAAIPSASCDLLLASDAPEPCKATAGRLADDAACGDDAQCASKYCSTAKDRICGKCGAAPAAGASCATGHCAPGLDCVKDVCVRRAELGAACNDAAPCRLGLSCTDGVCTLPAKNEGDSCAFDGKGAPNCDLLQGIFCAPLAKKCKRLAYATLGEKCGYDVLTDGFAVCVANGVCRKAKAGDVSGTCVAAAFDGQKCDTNEDVGPKCQEPAKCVDAICRMPDPASCK